MALRKIVCGASKPIKWKLFSALIMWWENTDASHVYFYIKRNSGIHLLYHAVGSGTEFMGYNYFLSVNKPVYEKEIEIPDSQFQNLLDYLVPRLKKKYSVKHLVGLFLKRLVFFIFKKNIPNYFADKDASEVCVEALVKMLDSQKIYEIAENPEDMGMLEALAMLETMPGRELVA
jgi:hypothetical protein